MVREIRPKFVLFENVPAIRKRAQAWNYLNRSLQKLGYLVQHDVLNASEFGVAQNRERLIVVASEKGVAFPVGRCRALTVRDAIQHLPEGVDESIPNHFGMKLSEINLKRISSINTGGKYRSDNVSFSDSYARMSWGRPAPTITTKCISFSNGRFGHPEFDRAITLREAATLQGFPERYEFFGTLASCARQIGNAVPPPVAKAIGKALY